MPPRLVLFTKPAVPGRVKTRLVGELSADAAAALHRAFLEDLAERLLAAEARGALELWSAWALEPGEAVPDGPGRALRQEGRDLGERLVRGLSRASEAGGSRSPVAALGSDHPTVPVDAVEEAFARIAAGADLVLGPSRDGGYYLLALAPEALHPELFEGIPWSTDRVLTETRERAAGLGLRTELLAEADDVDTPDDLHRLAATLAEDPGGAALCPRTTELLAGWGYLVPVTQEAS